MTTAQWIIEVLKIVAPLLALLGAWGMWLYDQRKRHDPYRQEIYRQRIADCRAILSAMIDAQWLLLEPSLPMKDHTEDFAERAIEAAANLPRIVSSCLASLPRKVLLPAAAAGSVMGFLLTWQAERQVPWETVQKTDSWNEWSDAFKEFTRALRDELHLEELDIDLIRKLGNLRE